MSCSTFTLAAIVVCAMTLPTHAQKIDPNNPPEGRFMDDWLEVYMGEEKIGYGHSTMSRTGNLIHSETLVKFELARFSQTIAATINSSATDHLGGAPRAFESNLDFATMKTATRGTVENGKVTVVTSQLGMEQTRTFDFPADAVGQSWGMFREGLLRGFKPGTHYTLRVYSPDMRLDDAIEMETEIGEWETFTHRGAARRGQRVLVTMTSPAGKIETTNWVGDNGVPIRTEMSMPGLGDMIMIVSDQATAMAEFVAPEIFVSNTIPIDRTLRPRSLKRVHYRLTTTNPEAKLGTFPTTAMQQPSNLTDHSVDLVLTRQPHTAGAAAKSTKTDLSEYLERNLMINTEDPKIIELARRAAGSEKEPYALADKLRRFVTQYVKKSNLNIGFATASEVCRTQEGDCSENGVLLAALGRINGLPSRVAVGVAYVESFAGKRNIFGYHLWTQFLIDGKWIDFDAALRESDCSPTRIAFATSSLKNAGLADLSLPLIAKIGAVSIEIIAIEESP